jgi:hypothetical protein
MIGIFLILIGVSLCFTGLFGLILKRKEVKMFLLILDDLTPVTVKKISKRDKEMCNDGYTSIFRFKNGVFEEFYKDKWKEVTDEIK